MASPKQFRTADEIEANPGIIRHSDVRQKIRNRSGQGGGRSKAYMREAVSLRPIAMQESPAYRVMSLSAHRVLDRLEIELAKHGFKPEENGLLPCTYEDFVEYGISRNEIAPAIRELGALGIARVTRMGSAGNEAHRQPTLFLLTYRAAGSDKVNENGWSRIKTIEEAEKIAKAAGSAKADQRASEFGRRGAKARWAKQVPVMESAATESGCPVMDAVPTKNKSPVMEAILKPVMETILKPEVPSHGNHTDRANFPVTESIPLTNICPWRGPQLADDASAYAPSPRPNPTPCRAWSAPRFRELVPVTEEPIGPWFPRMVSRSNAQNAGSAQLTAEVVAPLAPTIAIVH
jgi:hypothetical protein